MYRWNDRAMGLAGILLFGGMALMSASVQAQDPGSQPAPNPPGNVVQTIPDSEPLKIIPEGSEQAVAIPAKESANAPCGDANTCTYDSIWLKVPPVPVPRPMPGYFIRWPTGPGYYNALEQLQGNWREKPPPYPYVRFGLNAYPFFDYSFSYLDKPDNTEHDWLDPIKRIHLGDDFLVSYGGEFRFRGLNETNFQATGKDNSWQLLRLRLFEDFWYRDIFRFYVEFIDAQSFNHDVNPATNDREFGDLLDLFIDFKVAGTDDRYSYVRVGRQELLYGSQRLISPNEWANVRRTFDGFKFFSRGEKFDFDAFLTRPVLQSPNGFDSSDDKVTFAGAWSTYRADKDQALDFYYLLLSSGNYVATGEGGVKGGFDTHTLGNRYNGYKNGFMWDFEEMLQLGEWSNQSTLAGAYTTALGYEFTKLPAIPQFWLEYDYASGGSGEGGTHHTFNQLFPFGHYYFGYVDIVGRQNINDFNGQLVFFPTNWITGLIQFHDFYLNNAKDALYNAAGAPIRRDPSGNAGTNVGKEIDLLLNLHLTNHQFILLGYSHFYAGSFMSNTGNGRDIDFTYLQYNYRF